MDIPAAPDVLAFDRASVRSFDRDGRLHVEVANISKANVCPYLGREIPRFAELGLDPDKVYQLLRDPEELEKGASTFNNLPILSDHVHVTAEAHRPELVIGSTGSDAAFTDPYLHNSLSFWAGVAIDSIESEIKKDLSSAYHYRADMTPGIYLGAPYDGVMRDIVGNHLALVKAGRAGADVIVGDSNAAIARHEEAGLDEAQDPIAKDHQPNPLRRFNMTKALLTRKAVLVQGACMAALTPKLAQDAKIDFAAPFKGINAKNFKAKKPAIFAALKIATSGKLAQDADIEDVMDLLDALDDVAPAEDVDPDAANAAIPVVKTETADDEDPLAKVKEMLKAKGLSDEEIAEVCSAMEPKSEGVAEDDVIPVVKPDTVSKGAMDAAIASAVRVATENATKTQKDIRDAERAVRPYIGELALAHDSADGVYRTALVGMGIDVAGIHPSAFPAILKMQPVPGATPKKLVPVAMDAAGAKSFADRFPEAARIKTL